MYLSIAAGQVKIRKIITKCYMLAGVGKSTENVEVTEAGTYLSLFTEPSKNSMHEGISPKGCICEGILEFYPSS